MPELVTLTVEDRIAHLTLDSPANRNALSGALIADLQRHLATVADLAAADTLNGVLLASSQRVFCAGADLKEAASVDMVERARAIIAVQRALAACPVPVLARLDGAARAGGLGLVASCDLVLADTEVTFALTEVRLGLAAATISIPLLHRVAPRALEDWLLTGRIVPAAEAAAAGLITRAVPAAELPAAVDAVLTDLRRGIPQGLREGKRLVSAPLLAAFDARGEEMSALSGSLFHSPIAQDAMAAALRR